MRRPFPDFLATKPGRLATFFLLYVTEGIPLGFTATAIATQMRRQGLGTAEIGAFVATLYLPWAFKWAAGPVVDTFSSRRHGHYRAWILITQIGLVASLLVAIPVDFTAELKLFTLLILVHNCFGATQDVAIDALAVNVLPEHERGTANGFMFAGASVGQAIGGSGVLFLSAVMPFRATYLVVGLAIALVTLAVALPLREPPGPPRPERPPGLPNAARAIGTEILAFVRDAYRAFTGSRGAALGVILAILPLGAYALGLALQSSLAVDLGLNDAGIALLALFSTLTGAFGCIVGGWLSDKLGRRRMLALYIAGMSIPTFWLAWTMQQAGWSHAMVPGAPEHPAPTASLVSTFWSMTLLWALLNGFMYGTSTALFMDVTTPRVAATQFTAYMALSNLAIALSAWWQGAAVARFGYPLTLWIDGCVGLISIALLPFMKPPKGEREGEFSARLVRPDEPR